MSFPSIAPFLPGELARRRAVPHLSRRRAERLFAPSGSGRDVLGDDTGAATAEYAIATMAAVAFAGLLVVIMRSQPTNQKRHGMYQAARGAPPVVQRETS